MSIIKTISNTVDKWAYSRLTNRTAFSTNTFINPFSNLNYSENRPAWVSLRNKEDFEKAARYNPIVKAAIGLLAKSTSNGRKVLYDAVSGEVVPWTDKSAVVQHIHRLIVQRPNPLQSGMEFDYQGVFYRKVFGNRYVSALMPSGFDSELDIMNIEALYNLPSQFVDVRTTGKLYKQTELSGIIKEYAVTNTSPIERYEPHEILHFNEVNISSEKPTVMGISPLEVLRDPIANTQDAFQAMSTILRTRGAQGILSANNKDGQGTIIPLDDEDKEEVKETFKQDYGLLNGQNPFLLSPVPLDYIKTIMSSKELGIYEEFANNSILIGNEFNVPPELLKTWIQGSTYENQVQSIRRLYQDATIPSVEEDDQYLNYRLNLIRYGLVIGTAWEHIPALQANKKENSQAKAMDSNTAKEAYDRNIITLNEYRELIGYDAVDGGDKYKGKEDEQGN